MASPPSKSSSRNDPENKPGLFPPDAADFQRTQSLWVEPTTLAEANRQLNELRNEKTSRDLHDFCHRPDEVAAVHDRAMFNWSLLLKEVVDDLAINGKANATSNLLDHPMDDEDDLYLLQTYQMVAVSAIHKTLRESQSMPFWIVRKGLTSWINTFLPDFDSEVFDAHIQESFEEEIVYLD